MTGLGIVAALPAEATAFSGLRQTPGTACELSDGASCLQCGAGRTRAEAAAGALVERGAVALVSWGLAGGIAAECRAGDLVLPRHVVARDGERVPVDEAWRQRLASAVGARTRVHDGDLLETDHVQCEPDAKRELRAQDVVAVDMESAAIVTVAGAAGLPVLVVRGVCDPPDIGIPRCAVAGVRPDGTVDVRAVLSGVVRRPRELPQLLRLWRASTAGLRTLRAVARTTERRLAFRPSR